MAQRIARRLLGIKPPVIGPDWGQDIDSSLLRPSELANILDGDDIIARARLWEMMETRDAVIHSCLQTRKLAVAGKPWEIVPAGERRTDKKIAEFVREVLTNIEDFEQDIADLLDAVGKGFSVLRVNWQVVDGKRIPVDLEWIPQSHFGWHWETGQFGFYDAEGEFHTIDDYPGWFLVHNYRGRSAHPSRQGVLTVVAWMFLFKRYALRNWTIANELVGVPMRIGTYPPTANDSDIRLLKTALKRLGVDAWAVLPEGSNIQFIEPRSRGDVSAMFKSLIDLANAEIAKAILGQTATLEGTPGKLGSEKAREEVRQDLIAADARAVMKTIQRLVNWIVEVNFGTGIPAPRFVIRYEPPEDLAEKARTLVLLSKIGMGFPENWLRETFGIPAPKEGENIVQPLMAMKEQTPVVVPPRSQVPSQDARLLALKEQNPGVDEFILKDYLAREDEVKSGIRKALRGYSQLREWIRREVKKAKSLKELAQRIKSAKLNWDVIKPIGDALYSAMYSVGARAYRSVIAKYNARLGRIPMTDPADPRWAPSEMAQQWWRLAAFSVATVENKQALDALHDAILKAIKDGETLYDFRGRVDEIFDRYGIGETNPYHVETVFRTNLANAYMAGKWWAGKELGDDLWGYEYVAVMDNRTRDEHAALHGMRAKRKDPIWQQIWPPNGYNCRCDVDEIFSFETERKEERKPAVLPYIQFSGNSAVSQISFYQHLRGKVNWDELGSANYGLEDWRVIQRERGEEPPAMLSGSLDAQISVWRDFLGVEGKIVFTRTNIPVRITPRIIDKFVQKIDETHGQDNRFQWFHHMLAAIKNSTETWGRFELVNGILTQRIYFIKAFQNITVVAIAEVKNGELENFNVIPVGKAKKVKDFRVGVLLER